MGMHGAPQAQPEFLTVINLSATVPQNHLLRSIKRQVDALLKRLSTLFEDLYAPASAPTTAPTAAPLSVSRAMLCMLC
jgi:hypothetical protein